MATSLNASLNVTLNPQSLNASTKQVQQALGRITGQASEFQKSLDASTARVFAFGATTAVLNGVTQSFKKLVSTTIEVEKRLVEINSIFQATEATFNRFRNSIFQVAKETGQSFGIVADGAAELARQGLSAEETAKRLKASLVLTRISGLDAEKSVKALTAAINGFASAGLNANQIVNKLVAVDTAFAVSAQDLAEAFSRAGSTAEDAGVSFDQLLGLVTAVEQKTARGGAVIGNAFKSIFTRLQRGTTIAELKELGVQIDATMSGVQKLNALSNAIENIGDPTVVSKIKELAGGVFQINVVSAALKDLSSETSIFASAARTASAATNEAFEKNADLNKTIAAQINALVQGLTSLAERVGSVTFGPLVENLVGIATKFSEFLDKALDPEKGNTFIKGFFKVIGNFLSGPAIVIFTAAFVKISQLIAKFAAEGLKSLFTIGTQQEKIKNIEAGIIGLLQKDENLRNTILNTSISQARKEQAIINAIKSENSLLATQANLMRQIAVSASMRGVTGFSAATGFSGKGRKPFAVGGRVSGGSGTKDDVPAMLTAGEFVIKKSSVNKFGTDFMTDINEGRLPFNRGGFVPNYVGPAGALRAANITNMGQFRGLAGQGKTRDVNGVKVTEAQAENFFARNKGKKGAGPSRINVRASSYGFLVPSKAAGSGASAFKKGVAKVGGVRYPYNITDGIKTFSPAMTRNEIDKDAEPYDSRIEEKISKSVNKAAFDYAKLLVVPKGVNQANAGDIKRRLGQGGQRGAFGAIRGAVGAAFEAAVFSALGLAEFKTKRNQADWDVRNLNTTGNGEVAQIFNSGNRAFGDMKVGVSDSTVSSFVGKILKHNPIYADDMAAMKANMKSVKRNKGGLIPNYSGGRGVPTSFMRVHKDDKGSPIAVTNLRDEPNGLQDAIKRERKGIGVMAAGGGMIPNYAEGKMARAEMGLFLGFTALQQVTSTLTASKEQERNVTISNLEKKRDELKESGKNIMTIAEEVRAIDQRIKAEQNATTTLEKTVGALDKFIIALMSFQALNALSGGGIGRGVLKGGKALGAGIIGGKNVGSKALTKAQIKASSAARVGGRAQGVFGRRKGGVNTQGGKFLAMQQKKNAIKVPKGAGFAKAAGRLGPIGAIIGGGMMVNTMMDSDLDARLKEEKLKSQGGALAGGLAGAKVGAMAGGAIGSVVPFAGTAIGAGVGAIGGGILGAIGGSFLGDQEGAIKELEAMRDTRNTALGAVGTHLPEFRKEQVASGAKIPKNSMEAFQGAVMQNMERIMATPDDAGGMGVEQMRANRDKALSLDKAFRDAGENLGNVRAKHTKKGFLGFGGMDEEDEAKIAEAERELEIATLDLVGKRFKSAGLEAEFNQKMKENSEKVAAAQSKLEAAINERSKATKAAVRRADSEKESFGIAQGLASQIQGPFAGAARLAVDQGSTFADLNVLQAQKAQAEEQQMLQEAGQMGDMTSEEAAAAVKDAGDKFRQEAIKAGIGFKNKMAEIGEMQKQNQKALADLTAQEISNALNLTRTIGNEGVDIPMMTEQAEAIVREMEKGDKMDPKELTQLLAEFDDQNTGIKVEDLIKELGGFDMEQINEMIKNANKAVLMEGAQGSEATVAGMVANQPYDDDKRKELDQTTADLDKQLKIAEENWARFSEAPDTSDIASSIETLGESFAIAATNAESLKAFGENINQTTNQTAEVIAELKTLNSKVIGKIKQLSEELGNAQLEQAAAQDDYMSRDRITGDPPS